MKKKDEIKYLGTTRDFFCGRCGCTTGRVAGYSKGELAAIFCADCRHCYLLSKEDGNLADPANAGWLRRARVT